MTTADLLLRAGAYQALALGYAYPTAELPGRVGELLAAVDDDAGPATASPLAEPATAAALTAMARATATADPEAVEADFNRLFSGKVACAPHETAYEPDVFRRQRALADIAGFHAAFGASLPEENRWQADHVGVELELCALLLSRRADAEAHGWDEPAAVSGDALRAFLTDHLGRWGWAFSRRLLAAARTEWYRCLAAATGAWVAAEVARTGARPGPLADRPRSLEDDAPPACGGCPAAAGR